jgi:FkbM family methyltransferase
MLALELDTLVYGLWYGRFRRVFRAIVRRMLGSGFRVVMGPLKGQRYLSSDLPCRLGIYEMHIQKILVSMLNEGDTFYDVGANKGYLGLLGAHLVGESGVVYEFEPLPDNFTDIEEVMEKNNVTNYVLVPKAVSNLSGTVMFYYDKGASATSSVNRDERTEHRLVPATTLDEFAADHRFPQFIKLDVEGAEVLALQGAASIMAVRNAPAWVIEVHSKETDREVKRLLSANNYHIDLLTPPVKNDRFFPCQILARKEQARG